MDSFLLGMGNWEDARGLATATLSGMGNWELVSTLHVRSSVVGGKEDSSIVSLVSLASLVLLVSLASLVPLASLSSETATTPHDFGSAH